MATFTPNELLTELTRLGKTKQWYTGRYHMFSGQVITVKGFGFWIQRIETGGYIDSIPEQKTQKAFKAEIDKHIL